ncbi:hypothetical protein GOBAR_DD10160 [Gossypium barbadense]|nr:hypothetical protein GOBAR_DD10160 [Gossypium barbadense]
MEEMLTTKMDRLFTHFGYDTQESHFRFSMRASSNRGQEYSNYIKHQPRYQAHDSEATFSPKVNVQEGQASQQIVEPVTRPVECNQIDDEGITPNESCYSGILFRNASVQPDNNIPRWIGLPKGVITFTNAGFCPPNTEVPKSNDYPESSMMGSRRGSLLLNLQKLYTTLLKGKCNVDSADTDVNRGPFKDALVRKKGGENKDSSTLKDDDDFELLDRDIITGEEDDMPSIQFSDHVHHILGKARLYQLS